MKKFLEKLRNKPESTRRKIMWSGTAIVFLIILVIWSANISNQVEGAFKDPYIVQQQQQQQQQAEAQTPSLTAQVSQTFSEFGALWDEIVNRIQPLLGQEGLKEYQQQSQQNLQDLDDASGNYYQQGEGAVLPDVN